MASRSVSSREQFPPDFDPSTIAMVKKFHKTQRSWTEKNLIEQFRRFHKAFPLRPLVNRYEYDAANYLHSYYMSKKNKPGQTLSLYFDLLKNMIDGYIGPKSSQ